MKMDNRTRQQRFVVIVGLCLGLAYFAAGGSRAAAHDAGKPWIVPPAARRTKNPVRASPEGLAAAAKLYNLKCAPCHGATGNGDGQMAKFLNPKPANFADAMMMHEMTDGELYWEMSEGRSPMPAWKDQMTETERWQMVNYLRTFAPHGMNHK